MTPGAETPTMRICLLISMLALLGACGAKLEGSYADPTGMAKYDFRSGGKVYVSLLGITTEHKYEIDGKHVKILLSAGTQILDIEDDGSLLGPLGIELKKRP
jgi:hypothetical protein